MARGVQQLSLILYERGVLDDAAMEQALASLETSEVRFLARLLSEDGCAEGDLVAALAQRTGLPGVDFSRSVLQLPPLDLVPRAVAETDLMLPISTEGGRLHIVMLSPEDAARATDEVRFITGMEVSTYVAIAGPLEEMIAAAYDARERGEQFLRGHALSPDDLPKNQWKLCVYLPGESPNDPAVRARTGEIFTGEPPHLDAGEAPHEELLEAEIELVEEGALEPVEPAELDALIESPALSGRARPRKDTLLTATPDDSAQGKAAAALAAGARAREARRNGAQEIELEISPDDGSLDEEVVVGSVHVGPRRILVVDDEPDILRMLDRALTSSGYSVETAADGALAEAAIAKSAPDLVLLDAMLPNVHGFEICSRIKSNAHTRHVPVIMMSAVYRGWRFAQDARDAYGADDYVEKPFHLADLLHRVEERLAEGARKPAPQKEKAEQMLRKGLQLLDEGAAKKAHAELSRAVVEDPFSPRIHFALARALNELGDVFRAITEYERAIELRPSLFPALRNLAQLYLEKGFRRKTAETLERALQHAPDPGTRETIRAQLLRLL